MYRASLSKSEEIIKSLKQENDYYKRQLDALRA